MSFPHAARFAPRHDAAGLGRHFLVPAYYSIGHRPYATTYHLFETSQIYHLTVSMNVFPLYWTCHLRADAEICHRVATICHLIGKIYRRVVTICHQGAGRHLGRHASLCGYHLCNGLSLSGGVCNSFVRWNLSLYLVPDHLLVASYRLICLICPYSLEVPYGRLGCRLRSENYSNFVVVA